MMNNYTMEMTWKTLYNEKNPLRRGSEIESEKEQKENYCSTVLNYLSEIVI